MKTPRHWQARGPVFALLLCSPALLAGEPYSPYAEQAYPMNLYWGDTHLHTNISVDAYGMGNRALSPDDAYRFAKGEAVKAPNGSIARLQRPLDFLVITDHGVNMGVLPRLAAEDPLLLQTAVGQKWQGLLKQCKLDLQQVLQALSEDEYKAAYQSVFDYKTGETCAYYWKAWSTDYVKDRAFRHSVWQEVGANAERHYVPGRFTTFIGYEWTPPRTSAKSPNFHRNIIFLDNPDKTNQIVPFTVQDSENVEDLWAFLKAYEDSSGGQVLAIPHNGNLSRSHLKNTF